MNLDRPLRAALVLLVSTLAGCGSGSPPPATSSAAPSAATAPQPPWGVPPNTRPLPLPEKGKAYNNPQPRDNIKDGGSLTIPIAELRTNWNTFSVDGHSAYVDAVFTLARAAAVELFDHGRRHAEHGLSLVDGAHRARVRRR